MSINWFPGHMHKARKEIAEVMPQVDVIIEMLDARIPFSSENPLVPELRGETPVIKVLNKADLADPEITALWVAHMEQEKGIKALPLTQQEPEKIKALLTLCHEMLPERNFELRGVRAMIMGIPNVGKSTLINTLAGRIIAKTGNEEAGQSMLAKVGREIVELNNRGVLAARSGARRLLGLALIGLQARVTVYPGRPMLPADFGPEQVIARKADEQGASWYRTVQMYEEPQQDNWRAQAIIYA